MQRSILGQPSLFRETVKKIEAEKERKNRKFSKKMSKNFSSAASSGNHKRSPIRTVSNIYSIKTRKESHG
jgi:hypothetical protein